MKITILSPTYFSLAPFLNLSKLMKISLSFGLIDATSRGDLYVRVKRKSVLRASI
jgi:hypothetical protein